MQLAQMAKTVERFTIANSPALLTGVAVTGAVATAIFAGKASFKAANLIAAEEAARKDKQDVGLTEDYVPMDAKEKVVLVWALYIPAVSTCATTVVAMITANQIGTRRAATMAAAYSLSEKAFGEYKDKVVEKVGPKKATEVQDDLAQDRVNRTPTTQVIMANGGDVLCFDQHSGRYFNSDMETLKKAQNDTNYQILRQSYASLNDFYERVGLEIIPSGEELGWNGDREMDIAYSSVLSKDQRPCIAIDFIHGPIINYYKAY